MPLNKETKKMMVTKQAFQETLWSTKYRSRQKKKSLKSVRWKANGMRGRSEKGKMEGWKKPLKEQVEENNCINT